MQFALRKKEIHDCGFIVQDLQLVILLFALHCFVFIPLVQFSIPNPFHPIKWLSGNVDRLAGCTYFVCQQARAIFISATDE
jgi:hypothetical protein